MPPDQIALATAAFVALGATSPLAANPEPVRVSITPIAQPGVLLVPVEGRAVRIPDNRRGRRWAARQNRRAA
jgi:hypothetical protein